MSDLLIRMFQSSDLQPVLSIWNQALKRDPISESRFVNGILCDADYFPGEDSGFFVATRAGKPVGFLRAIIRSMPNDRVGVEPEDGWISIVAVDPNVQRQGTGKALLSAALEFFARYKRKRVWVCGNTGSAPGYVFPGVDKTAYAAALAMFLKAGFVVDHEPVAMSREIVNFDVEAYQKVAWETGKEVEIGSLTPDQVQEFRLFLAESFPGDWNIAARAKMKSGALHEILIAKLNDRIVGYCQWEGEHFGPFGVASGARNMKVGGKLFVEAVRRIREADGRTVWFNWADPDAARFYRRFGLTATREFAILRKDL